MGSREEFRLNHILCLFRSDGLLDLKFEFCRGYDEKIALSEKQVIDAGVLGIIEVGNIRKRAMGGKPVTAGDVKACPVCIEIRKGGR